jgi:hypothetical protein
MGILEIAILFGMVRLDSFSLFSAMAVFSPVTLLQFDSQAQA